MSIDSWYDLNCTHQGTGDLGAMLHLAISFHISNVVLTGAKVLIIFNFCSVSSDLLIFVTFHFTCHLRVVLSKSVSLLAFPQILQADFGPLSLLYRGFDAPTHVQYLLPWARFYFYRLCLKSTFFLTRVSTTTLFTVLGYLTFYWERTTIWLSLFFGFTFEILPFSNHLQWKVLLNFVWDQFFI